MGPALGGLLALAGLFAGWALNEISHSARRREAKRSFLSEALADLLEIRHRIVRRSESVQELTAMLVQAFGESQEQVRPVVSAMIDKFWPEFSYDVQLTQRFDAAVTKVASVDPILAFELRGKDWIMAMGARMRIAAQEDVDVQPMLESFHALALSQMVPTLDASISSIARQLGPSVEEGAREKLIPSEPVSSEMKAATFKMFQDLAAQEVKAPGKSESRARPRRRKR